MTKITESARGEQCQVRIPGVCNHNPETTVLAHLGGGGMGMKQPDCEGSYCCSDCHSVIDGQVPRPEGWTKSDITLAHHEGCVRTRSILIDKGLLICK
jgi:hypothetical protein